MKKYLPIIETIQSEYKTRTNPIDDLYIMGMCHAVQSIIINDLTISRKEYTEIYDITQSIINSIINI